MKASEAHTLQPKQRQSKQPGIESAIRPRPEAKPKRGKLRLDEKVAIITAGDPPQ